ncbi:MAG: hypothetical protein LIP03_02340 [Bacteroidales bacterium]|nr:hypothetical protein [Bacteroidales bacterium]
MKKIATYMSLAILALGMAACDNRPNVVGQWQGQIKQNDVGFQADYTVSLGFGGDGKASASVLAAMSEPMAETDSIVSPYQFTASGTATMSGTWQYAKGKDDEIVITFDPSSLDVQVQPEAVVQQENVFTSQQDPEMEALKPGVADNLKEKFTETVQANGMNVTITHVKVKKPLMEFKYKGENYVFRMASGPTGEE